jgi:DNA repair exonuclease SbcCD ATPase subunit
MAVAPQVYLAFSFDFDTLLPILFFVLYGLSQFLGGKKKKGEAEELEPEEDDAMEEARERARQIREEIQRKIRERQAGRRHSHGNGDWESPPVVMPPEPVEEDPVLARTDAQLERSIPDLDGLQESARERQPVMSEMEQRLEEQRARLAETKRKNEVARKEALRRRNEAYAKAKQFRTDLDQTMRSDARSFGGIAAGKFRDELIAGLRDPATVRQAILYREILDPPVGLR